MKNNKILDLFIFSTQMSLTNLNNGASDLKTVDTVVPIEGSSNQFGAMFPTTREATSDRSQFDHKANETNADGDCESVPPTVILNKDLIVDYKYAYFHHDDEDVQKNAESFVVGDDLEPTIVCAGDDCKTAD